VDLEKLETKVMKLVEKQDERREFQGADKRKAAARELVRDLADLLPPPWNTLVQVVGPSALVDLAELIIHLVRKAKLAEQEKAEAKAAAKKATTEVKELEKAFVQAPEPPKSEPPKAKK
jgi:hypothetical protein